MNSEPWVDGPVRFDEAIDAWVVSRNEDVRKVLRSDGISTSNRVAIGPRYASSLRSAMAAVLKDPAAPPLAVLAAKRARWSLLNTADPPAHDLHRRVLAGPFGPKQVAAVEPDIRRMADQLLDRVPAGCPFDVVSDFAGKLSAEVIAMLLGVPASDLPDFLRWAADISALFGNHDLRHDEFVRVLCSQGELLEYFAAELRSARTGDRDDASRHDVIATLARPNDDGDALTDDEIAGLLTILLVAGTETTANLISSAVARLATDAALAEELRESPERINAFVEEVLRLDAPSQGIFRLVTAPLEVGGRRMEAGDHLFLAFAAANRDSRLYDHPGVLDIEREQAHLAFGHGLHFCLGATLARREAQVAVGCLLTRFDGLQVVDGFVPTYKPGYFLRGLATLPVVLHPRL